MEHTQLHQELLNHGLLSDDAERALWIHGLMEKHIKDRRWHIAQLLIAHNVCIEGGGLDVELSDKLYNLSLGSDRSKSVTSKPAAPKKLSVKQKMALATSLKEVIFSGNIPTAIQAMVIALEPVLKRVVTYADVDDLLAWFPSLNNSPIRLHVGEKEKTEVVSQAGREIFIILDAYIQEMRKDPTITREGDLEFHYFSADDDNQQSADLAKKIGESL